MDLVSQLGSLDHTDGSEQEAIVDDCLFHQVFLAQEAVQPPKAALDQVAQADGEDGVVQLLCENIDEANDQYEHIVVQVAVQVALESREVRALVWHQVEGHLRVVHIELEISRARLHKALPKALLRDVVQLALVNKVEGLAEHMVDDALLPLLTHDVDFLRRQTLVIELIGLIFLNDCGVLG